MVRPRGNGEKYCCDFSIACPHDAGVIYFTPPRLKSLRRQSKRLCAGVQAAPTPLRHCAAGSAADRKNHRRVVVLAIKSITMESLLCLTKQQLHNPRSGSAWD